MTERNYNAADMYDYSASLVREQRERLNNEAVAFIYEMLDEQKALGRARRRLQEVGLSSDKSFVLLAKSIDRFKAVLEDLLLHSYQGTHTSDVIESWIKDTEDHLRGRPFSTTLSKLEEISSQAKKNCVEHEWGTGWREQGVYLHLEASELIENMKLDHELLMPVADVLIVLSALMEISGTSWGDVIDYALDKVRRTAKPS